ncbi:unnamed protein product [Amoebophrya sp. A25]|nr:unnamed protein product [Amoebophrya sp. A25]|eukprot:GSA25T00007366001.1
MASQFLPPGQHFGPPLVLRSKVALLGAAKSGKTALREVACENPFPRSYTVTLARESSVKTVPITEKNITVELHLQECGSFDRLPGQLEKAINGCSVFVLCYDVTDAESFSQLGEFLQTIDKVCEAPACVCVVGNKVDLPEGGRKVAEQTGFEFCGNRPDQMRYFDCSMLNNTGLPDMCTHIAQFVAENYEGRVAALNAMHGGMGPF